jgi:hypothetical protein
MEVVDYCQEKSLCYSIMTDQTEGLLESTKSIPSEELKKVVDEDGIREN